VKSSADITLFSTLQECAQQTLPFLLTGNVALSGGSTYSRLFPLWVELNQVFTAVSFFPVDERVVAFEDSRSNWGNAFRQFLSRVGRDNDREHFVTSAGEYRRILRDNFGDRMPVFDAVFLGVGGDGHTASLFPGAPYLDDMHEIALETISPQPPAQRVTLAPAVLVAAKRLIVIVAGSDKREIANRINARDPLLPIVSILSKRSQSDLFIDQAIAE
jgi:6-phosphogluconolactonase